MESNLLQNAGSILAGLHCDYAFYWRSQDGEPILIQKRSLFRAAGLMRVPILFAWMYLERLGRVSRAEVCELDLETPMAGTGLAWLLKTRRLPFHDVLLLMLALSDKLCTNLIIRRIGIERLNAIFRGPLDLPDARLERRLAEDEAIAQQGQENRISTRDCIRLYQLRDELEPGERSDVDAMLLACSDLGLWLRSVPRNTVSFHHSSASIGGLMHDWGYTAKADLFLLTENVTDQHEVYGVLDELGPLLF